MSNYDPERGFAETRAALTNRDEDFRAMATIMRQLAAAAYADQWQGRPDLADTAARGAMIAATSLTAYAQPGGETTVLNLIALFALALHDFAEGDMAGTAPRTPRAACSVWGAHWCARHGKCTCPPGWALGLPTCPLHGLETMHPVDDRVGGGGDA